MKRLKKKNKNMGSQTTWLATELFEISKDSRGVRSGGEVPGEDGQSWTGGDGEPGE